MKKYALLILPLLLLMSVHANLLQQQQNFSANTTWIVPTGALNDTFTIRIWGAGGAGAGDQLSDGIGAGGGGGGGYAETNLTLVPGTNFTIVVGVGGTGSTATTGPKGSPSWFNSSTTIFAGGGGGGVVNTGGAPGNSSIGTVTFNGGNGGNGFGGGGGGRGGGGGAGGGTNQTGNPGLGSGNCSGGYSPAGGNGGSGACGGVDAAGNAGTIPGGAGGGAVRSGSNQAGGSGANGRISISWVDTGNVFFQFLYETNNTLVNTTNVTLQAISSSMSFNQTTDNGTLFVTVLVPEIYDIIYFANGFNYRRYQFTLQNSTNVNLTLYMLPASAATSVTVSVVDNFGTALRNATVKLYLYNINTNTYVLDQVFTTDDEGIGVVDVQLSNVNYYFTVDYLGSTRLVTTPNPIYGSTVLLTVPLNVQGFPRYIDNINLAGIITNTTPTLFTFTWTDEDNIASSGCLYAYNITTSTLALFNYTCANTTSGTVNVGVNSNLNGTYYLYGVATKQGVEYVLDTYIVSYSHAPPTESTTKIWLFIMLLIILIVAAIFRESPAIAVLIIGIIPALFSGAHLINFGLEYTIPLLIIFFILSLIIGY